MISVTRRFYEDFVKLDITDVLANLVKSTLRTLFVTLMKGCTALSFKSLPLRTRICSSVTQPSVPYRPLTLMCGFELEMDVFLFEQVNRELLGGSGYSKSTAGLYSVVHNNANA